MSSEVNHVVSLRAVKIPLYYGLLLGLPITSQLSNYGRRITHWYRIVQALHTLW